MHLHLHSNYSIIDGRGLISEYVELAKQNGFSHFALTDHGTIGGTIEAYTACKDAGIKFIPGMEIYVDAYELRERNYPGHLTVLAKNESGYRALIAANNLAHRQFYYRPRITLKQIIDNQFAKDWIVLSGCMSSPFFDYPQSETEEMVKSFASHCGTFGLEVMWHGSDDAEFNAKQDQHIDRVVQLYKSLGYPVVMTNDCHYAHRQQELLHQDLRRVAINEDTKPEFDGEGFYFKTADQMQEIANILGCTNAVDNAFEFCKLSDVTIPEADHTNWYVPDITGGRPFESLRELAEPALQKLEAIYGSEYRERYEYELNVLSQSSAILNSYLVTYDVVAWCKERGIPIAARGSMAGSLVSHLLGITLEDPIKYRLSFSRAVNPARPSIPDFDLDVSSNHRGQILEYLKERYAGNIPICAYTHFGPRGALGKIMQMEGIRSFPEIKEFTKELPNDWPQIGTNYSGRGKVFVKEDDEEHKWLNVVPEQYHDYLATFKGLYSNVTVHPSGVLISGPERELEHEVPLQWVASSKTLTSAYDMYQLKKLGLFKLDVLGLSTLDQLHNMKLWSGAEPPDDNYDDPQVLEAFSSDMLAEIFQMDGYACREVLKNIHGVRVFEDIIAANTLARPGCSQFTQYYRSGYEGLLREYPPIQEVLGPTNGLILYQEQVMEISRILADFDDREQDDVKESIKYFRKENWKGNIEPLFRERCSNKGYDPTNILSAIERMASYTFNRAHAMTYAAIAYKMMWYKYHYPAVFYASVFDKASDKHRLVLESHVFGVKWHPADINTSEMNTVVRNGEIFLGLGAIKGVGPSAYAAIKAARPFTSIGDFEDRVERKKCNIRVITALREAFACTSIGIPGKYSSFNESFGFPYKYLNSETTLILQKWQNEAPNRLGGFVINLRPFTVKKPGPNQGAEMARGEIANILGKKGFVVFPEPWKKLRAVMYHGAPVQVVGQSQLQGDFIVEDAKELKG